MNVTFNNLMAKLQDETDNDCCDFEILMSNLFARNLNPDILVMIEMSKALLESDCPIITSHKYYARFLKLIMLHTEFYSALSVSKCSAIDDPLLTV